MYTPYNSASQRSQGTEGMDSSRTRSRTAMARTKTSDPKNSSAHLGFEARLWLSAEGSRVYDLCFSSGPRLVMAAEYRRLHGGDLHDLSLFGQDATPTARRFALMHFALRGIEADIGPEHADTFRRDLHPDPRAA